MRTRDQPPEKEKGKGAENESQMGKFRRAAKAVMTVSKQKVDEAEAKEKRRKAD